MDPTFPVINLHCSTQDLMSVSNFVKNNQGTTAEEMSMFEFPLADSMYPESLRGRAKSGGDMTLDDSERPQKSCGYLQW